MELEFASVSSEGLLNWCVWECVRWGEEMAYGARDFVTSLHEKPRDIHASEQTELGLGKVLHRISAIYVD
jgi:hypothetical protein